MNRIQTLLNKLDIQKAIIIPFVVIMLFFMVVTFFPVYTYTLLVAENNSTALAQKIRANIFDHIDDYLKNAENINSFNNALAQSNQLNIMSERQLGRMFLEEVKNNTSVDYVYYANEEGGIVSSGANKGEYTIATMPNMKLGEFAISRVDKDGVLLTELKRVQGFDPRTRSWYKIAKSTKKIFWSEVYGGVQEPILAITASLPLLNDRGDVVGVFGSDILLSKLATYIQTLEISDNGQAYLVEPNGLLIATSSKDKLFLNEANQIDRVNAEKSENPIIIESWKIVNEIKQQNDTFNFKTAKYKIAGQDYYLDISKYSYKDNVNWYLVIAIPESDFTKGINSLFLKLTALMSIILLLTVLFGVGIGKWVVEPIKVLNEKVLDIKNGNFGVQIETERRDVLGQLTTSFNDMAQKLKEFYATLKQKNNELENLNVNLENIVKDRTEELRKLSFTDELTGIYNHRYIVDFLGQKMSESTRDKIPLSLVMFDIDFFKRVNDTYGHLEGNKVLIDVVACINENVRGADALGRYGGEEFLLVLPYTTMEEAYHLAERIRGLIGELHIGNMEIKVTISGGVTEYNEGSLEDFIRKADENLYKAKLTGRNKIVKI